MCGIAGFIDGRGRLDTEERVALLDRMCRLIAHRGPDDQGTMTTPQGVALGMRRLSIIDLGGGHQPIHNEDASISIVFNGEIYNYRDLRRDLKARGHTFRTNSDTETIVHAYEEHGAECVKRLRGMFAFAIWDAKRRELFVARDRAGKKPLYYAVTPEGSFVFGSELKSLVAHPEVRREIDVEALDAYFTFGYVPDPLSIFRGVRKLPPGHHLTLKDGRVSIQPYWDFDYATNEGDAERSEDDYLEELRARLDDAVRVRLVADVPLGAFLSGGVDSSTVVGLMARAAQGPVKTFSIGFNEDSYNELKYARVAAQHFQTEHHEFVVTPDICQVVDELAWFLDEPFADSSAIPTYMVSKLAREHVKVVLSGDGGDELFAGYTRYVVDRDRSALGRVPAPLRRGLMGPLARRLPHGAWGRNLLHNIALDPLDRYIDSVSLFTGLHKRALYSDGFREQLAHATHNGNGANGRSRDDGVEGGAAASFRRIAARAGTRDPLDALLYLDSKTYLPGDILTKVDRMSMAVSLEARTPLLDQELIDFAVRIPARLKLRGAETKHIFKRAVREFVPAEILDRPKQGFGVPIQEWINQQLRGRIRETLTEPRAAGRGYVEPAYVRLLLDEHERGRRDHSARLWSLFMLELWHHSFAGDGGQGPWAGENRERPPAPDLRPPAPIRGGVV